MDFPLNPVGRDDLVLQVSGDTSGSDIQWNNGRCDVQISIKGTSRHLQFQVAPFTGNCGVKAVSHLYGNESDILELWPVAEKLLSYKFMASILMGSDYIHGMTALMLPQLGFRTVVEPVKNWNYGQSSNHRILVFAKEITPDYNEVERSLWQGFLPTRL